MLQIEYMNETLLGEPGPNFFWRGAPEDYLLLVRDFHDLGKSGNTEIIINHLDYVRVVEDIEVIAISSEDGNTLCERKGGTVLMDLTPAVWREMLTHFLILSFCPCHDYLDFADRGLYETANLIVSSEWSLGVYDD